MTFVRILAGVFAVCTLVFAWGIMHQ